MNAFFETVAFAFERTPKVPGIHAFFKTDNFGVLRNAKVSLNSRVLQHITYIGERVSEKFNKRVHQYFIERVNSGNLWRSFGCIFFPIPKFTVKMLIHLLLASTTDSLPPVIDC